MHILHMTRVKKRRRSMAKAIQTRENTTEQDKTRQHGARKGKAALGNTGQSTMQHAIAGDLVCKCQLGDLILESVLHSAAQELGWHHDVGGRQLDGRRLCQ